MRAQQTRPPAVYGPTTGDVSLQQDKFDQVKTVWRLTIRYASGRTIAYICVLGIVALLLSLWRGWAFVWWLVQWTYEVLICVLLAIWAHSFRKVSREYYAVAIRNPAWPLPYSQVDPHLAGVTGARDFPTLDGPMEQQEVVHRFKGTVVLPNGGSRLAEIETTTPDLWLRYAQALTRRLFPVKFSGNVAEHVFHIYRPEWQRIADSMCSNQMAYKTSYAENAHVHLRESGKEWFRSMLRGEIGFKIPEGENE